jgi:hypothetical protein
MPVNAKFITALLLFATLAASAVIDVSISDAQVLKKRKDTTATKPVFESGGLQFGGRERPPEPGFLDRAPFLLEGDELYYRAQYGWGYRINLAGFTDISARGPETPDLLGFSYRSDTLGLTLAHLYIHEMKEEFAGKSITEVFELYSARALEDTAIIDSTIKRDIVGQLYTLEYARKETWPQNDPNNPGHLFDSLLIRQHCYAIALRERSWLNIHLSKTEYQPADSLIFVELLETLEFVDEVPAFQIDRRTASEAGRVSPLKKK